jgi:hypothetical protein
MILGHQHNAEPVATVTMISVFLCINAFSALLGEFVF